MQYCLEGPTPSKLNSYFSTQQSSCVMNLLQTLRSIFNYCAKSEVDIDIDSLIENFKVSNFFNEIYTLSVNVTQKEQSLQTMRKLLENISNWIETISVCVSLLDIAYNSVQRIQKYCKKLRKKKLNEMKNSEQTISKFNEIFTLFKTNLEKVVVRAVRQP